MLAIDCRATIGSGPKALGFRLACAICGGDPAAMRANPSIAARSSLAGEVTEMKIAEIDWPLFWHALAQQDAVSRSLWLRRWVFSDDSVRLSMQSGRARAGSDDPDRGAPAKLHASEITNRWHETGGKNATRGGTKLRVASKERDFHVIG